MRAIVTGIETFRNLRPVSVSCDLCLDLYKPSNGFPYKHTLTAAEKTAEILLAEGWVVSDDLRSHLCPPCVAATMALA